MSQGLVFASQRRSGVQVSPRTGPLEVLADKRVLLVADEQNLRLGARDQGFALNWAALLHVFNSTAREASFHVALARNGNDLGPAQRFEKLGWQPHVKSVRQSRQRGRLKRDANADNLVAFQVGALMSARTWDLVVIGTGDGPLALDVAEAVYTSDSGCPVATLSLAGSTARRLDATVSSTIVANIEIGCDCLDRLRLSRSVGVY